MQLLPTMDTKLSLPTDKKDSRLISSKLVAVTAVVLGLAAIAGLSAVVAVTLPMAYYNSEASSLRQELENKEKMHSKVKQLMSYNRAYDYIMASYLSSAICFS